jgi:hypothetical protein
MMNASPALLPASTESPSPKPHPVDIALSALSEVATELLASGKASRFAELQSVTTIALQIQRLRPMAGVDEAIIDDGDENVGYRNGVMRRNPIRVQQGMQFNDGADLNREIIMLAQNFLAQYAEAEKKKASKPDPDVRLNEVTELAELFMLRLKLAGADESVPIEINARINQLLKRIGEPPHELQSDPVVSSLDVRGHPLDGAGEQDGCRVGEPLAE